MKIIEKALILVAILFGLATIFAGSRVLLGSDPGYIVYRPLLIYNTVMGIFYILAGSVALHSVKKGMLAAALIFFLNLLVLLAIYSLYQEGGAVAIDSLRAMTLRTAVWLLLFAGFAGLRYRSKL